MNRRERLASELSDEGLEPVCMDNGNTFYIGHLGVRAAAEWAGVEWREERTGTAVRGDGDEETITEVWVESWVGAMFEAITKYLLNRTRVSIWPPGSVGAHMELERELAGLLRHAAECLDDEARAALRVVGAMVDSAREDALLEVLKAKGFRDHAAVWPTDDAWRELKRRLKGEHGDGEHDHDSDEGMAF